MMTKPSRNMLSATGALAGALAFAPSAQAQSRGELLYQTHCIACHTTQMHWRDQRLATDWNSLKALVQRWQDRALLQWSEEDIVEVTRHLNDKIYRYPQPTDRLTELRLSIIGLL
jgi:mono/diheme cytochrome c family protein